MLFRSKITEKKVIILFSILSSLTPPGRLLDATKNYMFVFLLAGIEVTLSALVLASGNFLCIKRKQEEPEAKLEMAVTAAEKQELNGGEQEEQEEQEEPGRENGAAGVRDSVTTDSGEKNGGLVNSETSL